MRQAAILCALLFAAAVAHADCSGTITPAEIQLTKDFKPKEVVVRTNPDCDASEVRWSFAPLGFGIISDLSNVIVKKQPDGSFPEATFVVRANPNADLPPEGKEWPITPLGPAPAYKPIGPSLTVNITLGGGAAPPPADTKLPRSFPAASGMLKNGQYNQCLTIENNQHVNGAALVMRQCGTQPDAQTFTFGSNGELLSGNFCAVLQNNGTADDTPVVLWQCNRGGQGNEMWTFDNAQHLIGREFKKCLEPNGSDEPNHATILRPCWDGANQKWSVVQPPARLARTFPAASGLLKNGQYNQCLTIENNQHADGAHLVMAECGQNDAQLFTFGPNGELQNNGKCAVLQNSSTEDNTAVILWNCSGAMQSNEMWTLDNRSRLIGRDFGKCLEPNESDGTHAAILRPCWDGANQKWNVLPPAPARLAVSFPAASGWLKNEQYDACLTIENGQASDGARMVMAPCGSQAGAQNFTFGTNGEIKINGKCVVLHNNDTSDNAPIVLWQCNNGGQMNEMWTLDAARHLIGREFKKCMEPNDGDASHAAILRPCWDGANQKWNVEQPHVADSQGPSDFAVQFEVGALNGQTVTSLELSVGDSRTLEVFSLAQSVSGPVKYSQNEKDVTANVSITVEGGGVQIDRTEFPMRLGTLFFKPSEPGFGLSTTEAGNATIVATAVLPDGTTRVGRLPVLVKPNTTPGVIVGHWIEPTPVPDVIVGEEEGPQPGHGASAAPVDSGETLYGADVFSSSIQKAERSAEAFEGLAAAAAAAGEDVLEPEQIEMISEFSRAQSELLGLLRRSQPLPPVTDDDDEDAFLRNLKSNAPLVAGRADFDKEIIELFIQGGLNRAARTYTPVQTASLGALPLFFAMDVGEMAENQELMNDCAQHKCKWSEISASREPVEILVDMMRQAAGNADMEFKTSLVNDVLSDMNNKLQLFPKTHIKQWEFTVKALSVTGAVVALVDLMSQAQLKMMPSRIADLYANVGDQSRQRNAPAPTVLQGGKASLKVYMTAASLGGELVKPSDIINAIGGPLWDKMKDKIKAPSVLDRGKLGGKLGEQAENPAGVIGKIYKRTINEPEAIKNYDLDVLATLLVHEPHVKAWLQKIDSPVTVKPYKRGPFLINSEKVLMLKNDNQHNNRSKELIQLMSESKGKFYIFGKNPTESGKTAGYSYGLQPKLITDLSRATEGLPCVKPDDPSVPQQCGLFRVGVVRVQKMETDRRCDLGPIGSACSLAPANWAGPTPTDGSWNGIVTNECTCISTRTGRRY